MHFRLLTVEIWGSVLSCVQEICLPCLFFFFTDYYFYRTSKPESAKEVNPATCEKEMLCTSKTSNKAEHGHNASAHMCVQGSSYSLCVNPLSNLFFTGSL